MRNSETEREVRSLFQTALKLGIGSGMAASWGPIDDADPFQKVYAGSTSLLKDSLPISATTFFDLASLTKILATTSLYMILHERGILDVQAPLDVHLRQEMKQYPHLQGITIAELLSHTSGLPAWNAFHEEMRDRFGVNLPFVSIQTRKAYFYDLVLKVKPEAPRGEKVIYSDVGFLILSYLIEKVFQKPFMQVVEEAVWSQLSGSTFHFRPVFMDADGARESMRYLGEEIAATEASSWRGLLQGQVHDDNAWSMGGVAGHAGVFGTLNDCLRWIQKVFIGDTTRDTCIPLVSDSTLRFFTHEVFLNSGTGARRTFGFDCPSLNGSGSTAFAFSPNTVGHLGFTGTSLWVDLDAGFFAVLLTNRVHPSRADIRIRKLRQNFHTLIRR